MELAEILELTAPVAGYRLYPGGVLEVVRGFVVQDGDGPDREAIRGDIEEFSLRSRLRMAFKLAAVDIEWKSMLTVTYGECFPLDGLLCRQHRHNILAALQRRFEGVIYFWFLEFQRRGAPHVHILLTCQPGEADRLWWARYWTRVQYREFGLTGEQEMNVYAFNVHRKAWDVAQSQAGLKRYGVKYALKMEQKAVPVEYQNCGRFWGHTRGLEPIPIGEMGCNEAELRQAIKYFRDGQEFGDILPRYIFGFNVFEGG